MELTDEDKRFIGSFFTQQYALESTALFNPSIVPHPVQDKEGVLRFIISLRAIGEGHISSITFMEGEIDADCHITVAENSPVIYEPERTQHYYEKKSFIKKAHELGILTSLNRPLLEGMPDEFSYEELTKVINRTFKENITVSTEELEASMNNIRSLALSNFSLYFPTEIFPNGPSTRPHPRRATGWRMPVLYGSPTMIRALPITLPSPLTMGRPSCRRCWRRRTSRSSEFRR